jgi:hypothetical protein
MKFHPYSEVFPLIEGTDFDALVADIKEHGQREPIWMYDGKILDGRNRFLACQKAKLTPKRREFKGDDAAALAFVISANVQRRHMTFEQRALAAARVATLQKGSNQHTARAVSSQADAAEKFDVSSDSVQRAKKIVEQGSKALQEAVSSGEVPLKKAASVVDLPKSEQLAAAKAKPQKEPEPEVTEPQEDEDAQLEQAEKEYAASIDKVMTADDKLAAAHAELRRQAAEIASLKLSRNGYQNQCSELVKRIKALQRENDKLKRQAA